MNIRSFFITGVLLTLPVTTEAQVTLNATTGIRNQYVLTMVGVNVHDAPVFQGDLWWTLPHGLWADVWWNTSTNFEPGFNREVDYGIGWANDNLTIGAYYYDLYKQFSLEEYGDIVEPLAEASYTWNVSPTHKLRPYVQVNYFFATQSPGRNNGSFPLGGIQHMWSPHEQVTTRQDLSGVYDTGVFGADHGLVGRYSVVPTVRVADGLALSTPLNLTVPVSPSLQDRKTELTFGLDVILTHEFGGKPTR